jgi:hypothetical protein
MVNSTSKRFRDPSLKRVVNRGARGFGEVHTKERSLNHVHVPPVRTCLVFSTEQFHIHLSIVELEYPTHLTNAMPDTADQSLSARTQGLSTRTERPTPEFLRLLRCLTSPTCFEEQGRVSANPSSDRVSRFESLNDVAGRERRVFRKSPSPPHCRRSSINAPGPTEARNAPSPRSGGPGRLGSHPGIDRVGRSSESVNDVTGRELRVFRKSPCPPRARRS